MQDQFISPGLYTGSAWLIVTLLADIGALGLARVGGKEEKELSLFNNSYGIPVFFFFSSTL